MNRFVLVTLALLTLARPAAAHHAAAGGAARPVAPAGTVVEVRLDEWHVALTPDEVPPGPVRFHVTNAGQVPHAFEIEGHGLERRTPEIRPGGQAELGVTVPAAGARGRGAYKTYTMDKTYTSYEVYCPVGKGSHRMLGMRSELRVEPAGATRAANAVPAAGRDEPADGMGHAMSEGLAGAADAAAPRAMRLTGGGPVVQILPGPYPFAKQAQAIIAQRPPDQQADLTKKAHEGPYSNRVAVVAGDIDVFALDRGAAGDSVAGRATFTTQDGARWQLDLERVQTKDIPFNPRFGGVIMGLFYHGASGVHTPLVPTIQSSLALWAYGRLTRDGQPVADDAMVHIMLLSRTRRPRDWALDCWDCSNRPVEELQLQVTPSPGRPPLPAPGGVLFVNWEKSRGAALEPPRQAARAE